MKGQFMLISAVIVGLMLISTSSMISQAQSQRFHQDPEIYDLNRIKYEAGKVDMSSEKQRERFGDMVDLMPGYTSDTVAWDRNQDGDYDCFNVTLRKPGDRLQMNCVG